MPTAAQKNAGRKRARLELERDARRKDRERLKQLRSHVKHAKKLARAKPAEVRQLCKLGRDRLRAKKRAITAQYEHDLRLAVEREWWASRNNCTGEVERATSRGKDRVQRAAAALDTERAHQLQARVWARKNAHKKIDNPFARKAKRSADALAESDAAVENDIPHELLPVWRAVKRQIKGTERRSRSEAFLEWAAENAGDVRALLDKSYDSWVADMVEHESELRERVQSGDYYQRASDAQLAADVPF